MFTAALSNNYILHRSRETLHRALGGVALCGAMMGVSIKCSQILVRPQDDWRL